MSLQAFHGLPEPADTLEAKYSSWNVPVWQWWITRLQQEREEYHPSRMLMPDLFPLPPSAYQFSPPTVPTTPEAQGVGGESGLAEMSPVEGGQVSSAESQPSQNVLPGDENVPTELQEPPAPSLAHAQTETVGPVVEAGPSSLPMERTGSEESSDSAATGSSNEASGPETPEAEAEAPPSTERANKRQKLA